MGVMAIIAAASLAVSAASAGVGIAQANEQSKLQKKSMAAAAANDAQQAQLLQIQGLFAEMDASLTEGQLGDQAVLNAADKVSAEITRQQLVERRQMLARAAGRVGDDADVLRAQVNNANASLENQAEGVRAEAVNASAQTIRKSAKDLGTMRVLAAEAGLSGSSMTAMAREIAHLEGVNLGEVRAASGRELEGIALERTKVSLQALSTVNDLGRRMDEIENSGRENLADQQRSALLDVKLSAQDRQIERDARRNQIGLEAKKAGLQYQTSALESHTAQLGIQSEIAGLQASSALTNGIFGMAQTGLRIGADYMAGQRVQQAQLNAQRRLETYATGR